MTDKDMGGKLEESHLRSVYEKMKDIKEIEAEDENETRAAMFDTIEENGYDIAEWDKILAHEFDTFARGEKYDYVTDLRRTFDASISEPLTVKAFRKLPAHVFWDIKTP